MFYTLFHANPIPTALTQLYGTVINVNVEFLKYFSLQREDIIGRNFNGLGLGAKERTQVLNQLFKDGIIRDFDIEIDHPSNEKRNLLASVQRIDLDGTEALISTFIDITERVRAERLVRSLASDLTAAEQAERQRISQILHDDLQQRLFAVKMQLAGLKDIDQSGDLEKAESDVSKLQEALDESISITRNLSIDLSPAILQGEGLADALNWLAVKMRDQYGLEVELELNGVSTTFEDTLRILLFQAAREALFNVVKHSGQLQATILFERTDGLILMTIRDGGQGFDTDRIRLSGGLSNLKHRLSLMGCTLQVLSQPREGTQVVIDIPIQRVKE